MSISNASAMSFTMFMCVSIVSWCFSRDERQETPLTITAVQTASETAATDLVLASTSRSAAEPAMRGASAHLNHRALAPPRATATSFILKAVLGQSFSRVSAEEEYAARDIEQQADDCNGKQRQRGVDRQSAPCEAEPAQIDQQHGAHEQAQAEEMHNYGRGKNPEYIEHPT